MRTLRLQSVLTGFVLFCCLYGVILVSPVVADIQYVSDLLIISIRESQSPEAPVLGYLPSAATVEVLEETQDRMLIRTEDGIQGWVRKKFIVKDKPKAVIISELEEQIALLEENIKILQQGSDTQGLINTINEYKKQVATLSTSLENEKKSTLTLKKNLQQLNATHQALARTLGVRRVGVTNAAGLLQKQSILSYSRGDITILDRTGLEEASCICYQVSKDVYNRILG